MGDFHESAPDVDRQAAAGRFSRGRGIIVAEPHSGDQVRRVADEPGIAKLLAGAGLAGRRPGGKVGAARGAGNERLVHHGVHHRRVAGIDDAAERVRRARVERLAVGCAHALDDMRRNREAAIGERRIGGDELDEGDFRGAQRDRGVLFELGPRQTIAPTSSRRCATPSSPARRSSCTTAPAAPAR
jgi:hypothetical protein